MVQNYTEEKLVQFIYGEVSFFEHFEIENAVKNDHTLKKAYNKLKQSIKLLPKVSFYPSKSILENVLSYSKQNRLEAQF